MSKCQIVRNLMPRLIYFSGKPSDFLPVGVSGTGIGKYSETCLKRPLKKNTKIGFQYRLSLNADHSALLLTFIKLSFAIKTLVLSFFKWTFKTGFTVN